MSEDARATGTSIALGIGGTHFFEFDCGFDIRFIVANGGQGVRGQAIFKGGYTLRRFEVVGRVMGGFDLLFI